MNHVTMYVLDTNGPIIWFKNTIRTLWL